MANCCGGASSVIITGGDGMRVTGSGTITDPYVISGDPEVVMKAGQTDTVNMVITGSGTISDPYVMSADVKADISDLADVSIVTTPSNGQVLMWNGGQWVAADAPTQEPGAVNTGGGIQGDGTLATPIELRVSNLTETAATGLATYIDINGELRAVAAVPWSAVTGKPSTFTPSSHSHGMSDLTGIRIGTSAPSDSLGVNGDIYLQYV